MGAHPVRGRIQVTTTWTPHGADKMDEEIKAHLDRIELDIWTALNAQMAETRILGEVVQCMAASVPDLNPVMERLLSRKDELLAQSSPENAKLYAERLERWHVHLLYAQRIVQKGQ